MSLIIFNIGQSIQINIIGVSDYNFKLKAFTKCLLFYLFVCLFQVISGTA